jgi:hypothetical protein
LECEHSAKQQDVYPVQQRFGEVLQDVLAAAAAGAAAAARARPESPAKAAGQELLLRSLYSNYLPAPSVMSLLERAQLRQLYVSDLWEHSVEPPPAAFSALGRLTSLQKLQLLSHFSGSALYEQVVFEDLPPTLQRLTQLTHLMLHGDVSALEPSHAQLLPSSLRQLSATFVCGADADEDSDVVDLRHLTALSALVWGRVWNSGDAPLGVVLPAQLQTLVVYSPVPKLSLKLLDPISLKSLNASVDTDSDLAMLANLVLLVNVQAVAVKFSSFPDAEDRKSSDYDGLFNSDGSDGGLDLDGAFNGGSDGGQGPSAAVSAPTTGRGPGMSRKAMQALAEALGSCAGLKAITLDSTLWECGWNESIAESLGGVMWCQHLTKLTGLEALCVPNTMPFMRHDLLQLMAASSLQSLLLRGKDGLDDFSARAIVRYAECRTQLRHLSLKGDAVDGFNVLALLPDIAKLTTLRSLSLRSGHGLRVRDKDLLLLTTLTQLTYLSLHDNACSDRAKSRFLAAVPSLKYEVQDDDMWYNQFDGGQLKHALLDAVPEVECHTSIQGW